MDALVTNRGRTVTGLTAGDFELRDEGVLQRVEVVDVDTLALNVILAVDTAALPSGGNRLGLLRGAAEGVLDSLQTRDRVALLSFSNEVRLLSPLTSRHNDVRRALTILTLGGDRSAIRDAVFLALAMRQTDPGRTVILVFSHGRDSLSWCTPRCVIDAARRTDAVTYAVAVRIHGESPRDYGTILDQLTSETGGRVMFAEDGRDLRGVFVNIIAESRGRYVLTYAPSGVDSKGWHRLEVTLKGKPGNVTARRGYFAE